MTIVDLKAVGSRFSWFSDPLEEHKKWCHNRDPNGITWKNNIVAMIKFFSKYTGMSHARGILYEGSLTKKEEEELAKVNNVSGL